MPSFDFSNISTDQIMSTVLQTNFTKKAVASRAAGVINMDYRPALRHGQTVEIARVIAGSNMLQPTPAADTEISYGTSSDATDLITVDDETTAAYRMGRNEYKSFLGDMKAAALRAAELMSSQLINYVDGIILGEFTKAKFYILDDGSGNPTAYSSTADKVTKGALTLSTNNIFTIAQKSRDRVLTSTFGTDDMDMVSVVPIEWKTTMETKLSAKDVPASIPFLQNGLFNSPVAGFLPYATHNLTQEYTIQISGALTADDTITISAGDGMEEEGVSDVVLTAKAAPSAEGEFDVNATASDQADAIVNMFNGVTAAGVSAPYIFKKDGGTTGKAELLSHYYRASAEKVVDGSDVYVRVYFKSGKQTLDVSSATNVAQTRKGVHTYFGKRGAISAVMLEEPNIEFAGERDQTRPRYLYEANTVFGKGVTTSAAKTFVSALLNI